MTNPDQSYNDPGVKVNYDGTNNYLPLLYGQHKVGGPSILPGASNGTDVRDLYSIVALSVDRSHSIDEVFINDVPEDDESFTGRYTTDMETVTVNGESVTRPKRFLGSRTEVVSPLLLGCAGWTSRHIGNGVTHIPSRFRWLRTTAASINPYRGRPKITALGKFRIIADATVAGAVAYDDETVRWSINPADVVLDYLRSEIYGGAIPNSEIDFPTFALAARKCAETVTYADGSTGPWMVSNANINCDKIVFHNIKELLRQSRLHLSYRQSKWVLLVNDGGNATSSQSTTPTVALTVTEDMIVKGTVSESSKNGQAFNRLEIEYLDGTQDFTMNTVIYPIPGSAEDVRDLAEDGGIRLTRNRKYPFINNRNIAAALARTIYLESRNRQIIQFTGTPKCMALESFDVIEFNYGYLGIGPTRDSNGNITSRALYKIIGVSEGVNDTYNITAFALDPSRFVFNDTGTQVIQSRPIKFVDNNIRGFGYEMDSNNTAYVVTPQAPPMDNEISLPSIRTNNVPESTRLMEFQQSEFLIQTKNVVDSETDQYADIDITINLKPKGLRNENPRIIIEQINTDFLTKQPIALARPLLDRPLRDSDFKVSGDDLLINIQNEVRADITYGVPYIPNTFTNINSAGEVISASQFRMKLKTLSGEYTLNQMQSLDATSRYKITGLASRASLLGPLIWDNVPTTYNNFNTFTRDSTAMGVATFYTEPILIPTQDSGRGYYIDATAFGADIADMTIQIDSGYQYNRTPQVATFNNPLPPRPSSIWSTYAATTNAVANSLFGNSFRVVRFQIVSRATTNQMIDNMAFTIYMNRSGSTRRRKHINTTGTRFVRYSAE